MSDPTRRLVEALEQDAKHWEQYAHQAGDQGESDWLDERALARAAERRALAQVVRQLGEENARLRVSLLDMIETVETWLRDPDSEHNRAALESSVKDARATLKGDP